jgi:hypothetical protein
MPVYATYEDLEKSLDGVIVAQLCSDAGEPMPGANPITEMALERASGVIRSYAMVGGQYTDANLSTLSASSDPMLVMLTVDLAAEFLFQRRATKIPAAIEDRLKRAYSALEALRDGKMIFGAIASAIAAGQPEVKAIPSSVLNFYARASNQPFFPYRKSNTAG